MNKRLYKIFLFFSLFSIVGGLIPTSIYAESDSSSYSDADRKEWGKRSKPVPLGEEKEITYKPFLSDPVTMRVTLVEIIRGQDAIDKLIDYNSLNEYNVQKVAEGYEYNLVKFRIKYDEGSDDDAYSTPTSFWSVKVLDEKGKEVKDSSFVVLNDQEEFGGVELYPGSEHEGYYALIVPKDGKYTVSVKFGKPVFFASE